MAARRPRVLLTGATGQWGRATLRELWDRDRVDVVAFAQPTALDRRLGGPLNVGRPAQDPSGT